MSQSSSSIWPRTGLSQTAGVLLWGRTSSASGDPYPEKHFVEGSRTEPKMVLLAKSELGASSNCVPIQRPPGLGYCARLSKRTSDDPPGYSLLAQLRLPARAPESKQNPLSSSGEQPPGASLDLKHVATNLCPGERRDADSTRPGNSAGSGGGTGSSDKKISVDNHTDGKSNTSLGLGSTVEVHGAASDNLGMDELSDAKHAGEVVIDIRDTSDISESTELIERLNKTLKLPKGGASPGALSAPKSGPELARAWKEAAEAEHRERTENPSLDKPSAQLLTAARQAAVARAEFVTHLDQGIAKAGLDAQGCDAVLSVCLPGLSAVPTEAQVKNIQELHRYFADTKDANYSVHRLLDVLCDMGETRFTQYESSSGNSTKALRLLDDRVRNLLEQLEPPHDGAGLLPLMGRDDKLDASLIAVRKRAIERYLTAAPARQDSKDNDTKLPHGQPGPLYSGADILDTVKSAAARIAETEAEMSQTLWRLQYALRSADMKAATSLQQMPPSTSTLRDELGPHSDQVNLLLGAVDALQSQLARSPEVRALRQTLVQDPVPGDDLGEGDSKEAGPQSQAPSGSPGATGLLLSQRMSGWEESDGKSDEGRVKKEDRVLQLVRLGLASESQHDLIVKSMRQVQSSLPADLKEVPTSLLGGGKDEDKLQRLGDRLLRGYLGRAQDMSVTLKKIADVEQALKDAVQTKLGGLAHLGNNDNKSALVQQISQRARLLAGLNDTIAKCARSKDENARNAISGCHELALTLRSNLESDLELLATGLDARKMKMKDAYVHLRDTVRLAVLVQIGAASVRTFQPSEPAPQAAIVDRLRKWGVPVDSLDLDIAALLSESFGPDELNVWSKQQGGEAPRDRKEPAQELIDSVDRMQMTNRMRYTYGGRVNGSSGTWSYDPVPAIAVGGSLRLVKTEADVFELGRAPDSYELVLRRRDDQMYGGSGVSLQEPGGWGTPLGIRIKFEESVSGDYSTYTSHGAGLRFSSDEKGAELLKKTLAPLVEESHGEIVLHELGRGAMVGTYEETRTVKKAGFGGKAGIELGVYGGEISGALQFAARLGYGYTSQTIDQSISCTLGSVSKHTEESHHDMTAGGGLTARGKGWKVGTSGEVVDTGGNGGSTERTRHKVVRNGNGFIIGSTEYEKQLTRAITDGWFASSNIGNRISDEFRGVVEMLRESPEPADIRLASELGQLLASVHTDQLFCVAMSLDERVATAINRKLAAANAVRADVLSGVTSRQSGSERAQHLEREANEMLKDQNNYALQRVYVMRQHDKSTMKGINGGFAKLNGLREKYGVSPKATIVLDRPTSLRWHDRRLAQMQMAEKPQTVPPASTSAGLPSESTPLVS